MKLIRLGFVTLFAVGAFAFQGQAPTAGNGKTHLKVGDTAPEFTLNATTGKPVSLADYHGKSTVVLAFFPAAFTGGCTKEMTAYQADIAKFQGEGAEVFAVSTDNLPTLKHWGEEHLKTSFPFLSDFMRTASTKYGVLMPERGIANRTTFVIDAEGKIQHIDEGSAAIDVTGAATACSRVKRK